MQLPPDVSWCRQAEDRLHRRGQRAGAVACYYLVARALGRGGGGDAVHQLAAYDMLRWEALNADLEDLSAVVDGCAGRERLALDDEVCFQASQVQEVRRLHAPGALAAAPELPALVDTEKKTTETTPASRALPDPGAGAPEARCVTRAAGMAAARAAESEREVQCDAGEDAGETQRRALLGTRSGVLGEVDEAAVTAALPWQLAPPGSQGTQSLAAGGSDLMFQVCVCDGSACDRAVV